MIGHVSIGVRDIGVSAMFYDTALAALGYVRLWTGEGGLGYGPPGGGERLNVFERENSHPPGEGFHLAFAAPDRASVDGFHAAAITYGGRDAGAPGPRPDYSPSYYAAFVIDPDGWKLEAVHQ